MKTFYLQIRQTDNVITDCIEYAIDGYTPVSLAMPLTDGLIGGWFKLENGVIVEHPELKPITPADEINTLKSQVNDLNIAFANMMGV